MRFFYLFEQCVVARQEGVVVFQFYAKHLEDSQVILYLSLYQVFSLNTPMYSSKMVHINQSLDEVYECDLNAKISCHSSKLQSVNIAAFTHK